MSSRGAPDRLTEAEERLLPLLATSLSLKEIAALVDRPRAEVERDAVSIYRKLELRPPSDAS